MDVTKGDVLQILKREMHELVDNPQKADYIDYESLKKLLNCYKLWSITCGVHRGDWMNKLSDRSTWYRARESIIDCMLHDLYWATIYQHSQRIQSINWNMTWTVV